MSRVSLAALSALIALSACTKSSKPVEPEAPPKPDPDLVQKLGQISALATGLAPPQEKLAEEAEKIAQGKDTLDAFIDRTLDDRRFGETMASVILRPGPWLSPAGVAMHMWIKQSPIGPKGEPVFHLFDPCKPNEIEKVHPWWAPSETVLICKDSYQPDRFTFDAKNDIHCDSNYSLSNVPVPLPKCGCGPNMIRCFKDPDQVNEYMNSMAKENVDTFALVVNEDKPVSEAFLQNETIRDRKAEAMYRRVDVERGVLPPSAFVDFVNSKEWPEAGKLAPRHEEKPGQHAGVFTTVATHADFNLRERMMLYESILWCTGVSSVEVTAEAIRATGATNLRAGDGWQHLAAQPVCGTCHARMDYGMQFFLGFSEVRRRQHYDPKDQLNTVGKVFLNDAKDLRGEGPLSPHGFVEIAVQQPEFKQCMAERVTGHVFSYKATPSDREAVKKAFSKRGSLKDAMKTALELYLARGADTVAATPMHKGTLKTAALATGDSLQVTPKLAKLVDQHCLSCHDEGAGRFDQQALPRELLTRMLSNVAFGVMPEDEPGGLPMDERQQFANEIITSLFKDEADQALAQSYYDHWMRALPVHASQTATATIFARAKNSSTDDVPAPLRWRWPNSAFYDAQSPEVFQLTPAFATSLGLDALKACKSAHKQGAELDACLDRATDPSVVVRDAFSPTRSATASADKMK